MNYMYNKDNEVIQEQKEMLIFDEAKKEKDVSEEDDGLLDDNKKKKKENPHYTDFKNKRIMDGKFVPSEQGWKRMERLKKAGIAVGVVGTAIAAKKISKHNKKMINDPVYKAQYIDKKTQQQANRTYLKQAQRNARQEGQRQARRENALRRMEANQNYKEVKTDKKLGINQRNDAFQKNMEQKYNVTAKKSFPGYVKYVKNKVTPTTYQQNNNPQNIVHESRQYTDDEILNYLNSLDENVAFGYSKIDNPDVAAAATNKAYFERRKKDKSSFYSTSKSEEYIRWKKYVSVEVDAGRTPMSFKDWRQERKDRRSLALKKAGRIAAGALIGAEIAGRATGHGGVVEMSKRAIDRGKAAKYNRSVAHRNDMNDRIRPSRYNNIGKTTFEEELNNIPNQDMANYLDMIEFNEDFKKESYVRYCTMVESMGGIPLDETAYEQAKQHLTSYTNAAIDGIRAEKRKKEKLLEERRKKKEEERQLRAEADHELMKDMSPEERKEYIRRRKKDEDKEDEKDKLWTDFKSSFVKGGGEELGHAAAKMVTKLIVK